ncbi:MAG: HAD-IIIA family hydrolase [Bacteroidales bacterium]|nr:HAD-IIIA family hydrolase [Candidatus Colicola coprequi]
MKPLSNIKLFLSDVDGCMTDGGMYYSDHGDEMKRFCVYDGMGMVQLRKAGIPCGILTSETSEIVARRAKKLNLDFLRMGVGRQVDDVRMTKKEACEQICHEMGISMDEVCFVGDDINDIDLLEAVGVAVCPQNARPEVKAISGILVMERKGGDGAIREICDRILESKTQK